MPPGKLSAQTGHAYTNVLSYAQKYFPNRFATYGHECVTGSKVALKAKNVNQLIKAYEELTEANIPTVLVVDQSHILPPDFNGSPIITALGIGPCTKEEVRPFTKKFQCI